jgi:hypothetical protein
MNDKSPQSSSPALLFGLLPLFLLFLPGCEVIGAIFRAGVWVGVLTVFAVIGLIIWGLKAFLGGRGAP